MEAREFSEVSKEAFGVYVVFVEVGQERWDVALFGSESTSSPFKVTSTSSPLKVPSTIGEAYNLLSRHLHHPPPCCAYR